MWTVASSAMAADIYVSPTGSDRSDGTQAHPLASLAAARDAARSMARKESVNVHVADGVYYLPETLTFTPQDSGTAEFPVVYQAENEGQAVLSGGSQLALTWVPWKDGIYQAKTPAGLEIDQLFVEGRNQRMARYPNYDAARTTEAYQGFAADAFSLPRIERWADPEGGYIHSMHRARWGGYHYRITGKDASGEVTYEGGWQNNRQMGMHKDYRMVENIFEELDAPGEWFHDAGKQTLYYMPAADIDLKSARIEVVRLRHLIEFLGSEADPVKFITLNGFVIRHAARTFMDTKEPLLRSDWAIYRGGAIFLTGTEDVQILDSEFDQVGGNALFASEYNRRLRVKGCHIHDAGASGVCFVGDPAAVRNPLFEYNEKNDLDKIDRTPGPQTNNYPADSIVEDCLIHGIGRVERQPAGVLIEMASQITVRDCSIYDCARAGINIGDGAWGGHLIEGCDVFDTVQETHDHGSFNSWGRDRYWRSDHLTASQQAVDADPKLPFLDAMETTVIRNSRWRCDHGWDIDLDDGSSNYDLYNNLMLAGGLKFREGFRRRAWNNVTVNNGFHPHVWFNNSNDEVFGNIFMAAHRGARMPSDIAKGKRVDGNLFYSPNADIKDRFVQFDWDVNSIAADPQFVDPSTGDFRVQEGSPAFDIGFKNFPMDQFGVKKPSLKAIAKTPVIPPLNTDARNARGQGAGNRGPGERTSTILPQADRYWLGAKLHALEGDEFSSYGVAKKDGGVALVDVPPSSEASRLGFNKHDLIQGLNEHKIVDLPDFFAALAQIGATPLKVAVVRDQERRVRPVTGNSYIATETSDSASGFSMLAPSPPQSKRISTRPGTSNQPPESLVDGKLAQNYGPVFGNGIHAGAYKMDLGGPKLVAAITSWSFQLGERGAQKVTCYASNATSDPGWDTSDPSRYQPLGSIDTSSLDPKAFTAASLRAPEGQSLGTFRWILWSVSPVTSIGGGENTAFQELAVEITP